MMQHVTSTSDNSYVAYYSHFYERDNWAPAPAMCACRGSVQMYPGTLSLPPSAKSNPSFVVKNCHHQPAPHKESYYSRSSDIVALIRVDPSLVESFLLVENLRCNSAVSLPLSCVLLPGLSILIVTTWAARKPKPNSFLAGDLQPASQPAHSPTSLSQAFLSINRPPSPTTRSPTAATERADKTPVLQAILLLRTKGTPIIMHTSYQVHPSLTIKGTMLLGAGLRGVSRHTNVCAAASGPQRPGGLQLHPQSKV